MQKGLKVYKTLKLTTLTTNKALAHGTAKFVYGYLVRLKVPGFYGLIDCHILAL